MNKMDCLRWWQNTGHLFKTRASAYFTNCLYKYSRSFLHQ